MEEARNADVGQLSIATPPSSPTIDGNTDLTYSDNVPERFEAYGWHVVQLGEAANDLDALEAGLRAGIAEEIRPTLIVLRFY